MQASGSCLCQAVKVKFDLKSKTFDACHCSMCRKWNGSPAFAVESKGNVQFEGEENISTFSSSDWAERGFCKVCGSNLFYRLKDQSYMNFNLGILDNQDDFEFTVQIFVDHQPKCYEFANKTKMMTEAEVLAAFNGEV